MDQSRLNLIKDHVVNLVLECKFTKESSVMKYMYLSIWIKERKIAKRNIAAL